MTSLLIAVVVAVVIVSRRCRQPLLSQRIPIVSSPAEVRVKAVERNSAANVATAVFDVSRAVVIICGKDPATANRYEERNNALHSIVRRRDLPKEDVTALMAYLQSTKDGLRPERIATLVTLPRKGLAMGFSRKTVYDIIPTCFLTHKKEI